MDTNNLEERKDAWVEEKKDFEEQEEKIDTDYVSDSTCGVIALGNVQEKKEDFE